MTVLLRQRELLDRTTRQVAILGFSGLVLIGLITMFDALARHLGWPRVPGFDDIGEVVFTVVIASCFPAGLLHSQNVSITFLGDCAGGRTRAVLEALAGLATLAFFCLLAFQFLIYTWDIQTAGRVTTTILMPVAPWWWITAAILVLTVPVQAWVVAARIEEAIVGIEVVPEEPLATTDHVLEEDILTRRDDDEGGR